jgi:hypothetical protein
MQSETIKKGEVIKVGGINERGYLNGLHMKGFNQLKCILELCANAVDAYARIVKFIELKLHTLMIDDGTGMGKFKMTNYYLMQNENHGTDNSSGIAGMGGKVAQMMLSEKTYTEVFSYDGSSYMKAAVPWDQMYEQGKYTDMINITCMTQEDIKWFKSYLPNTGTIIKFIKNNTLTEAIKKNFPLKKEKKTDNKGKKRTQQEENSEHITNFNDLIGIAFSQTNTNFFFTNIKKQTTELEKYYYFGAKNTEYYLGVDKITIGCYSNGTKLRFIRYDEKDEKNNKYYEIKPSKNGLQFSSTEKIIEYPLGVEWEKVGEVYVTTGQRKDIKKMFNDENPKDPINKEYLDKASSKYCSYDDYIANKTSNPESYLKKIPVVRNEHVIGGFKSNHYSEGSSRGNAYMKHKTVHVRGEVSYNPISKQLNKLDEIFGINENKNLWLGELPINLTRLVERIIMRKADEIWQYFTKLLDEEYKLKPSASSVSSSISKVQEETPTLLEETPTVQEEPSLLRLGDELEQLQLAMTIKATEQRVLAEETPTLQEETPTLQEETPTLQEETPTLKEEPPTPQEETPTLQEETPTQQEQVPEIIHTNLVVGLHKNVTAKKFIELFTKNFQDNDIVCDESQALYNKLWSNRHKS